MASLMKQQQTSLTQQISRVEERLADLRSSTASPELCRFEFPVFKRFEDFVNVDHFDRELVSAVGANWNLLSFKSF